jgi:GT2 family glycosyltransferase
VLNLLAQDPRIEIVFEQSKLGISNNTNRALATVSTQYFGLLDQDDLLLPSATASIVAALQQSHPDILYTDEAKISDSGVVFDPFFKPDWSPVRFAHQMYIGHCLVLKADLVRELGGFDADFDFSQDYELVLRMTREPRVVHHVEEILYLWRSHPGSSASDHTAKPAADDAAMRAISKHLSSESCAVSAFCRQPGVYRLEYRGLRRPMVSIVMPTAGMASKWNEDEVPLSLALEALCMTTNFRSLEVVIVADTAQGYALARQLVAEFCDRSEITRNWVWRVIDAIRGPGEDFNFSRSVNMGVAESSGELLLLLNDDVEVSEEWWLDHLVSTLLNWNLGAVGPILVERNGTVSEAGISTSGTPMNIAQGLALSAVVPFSSLLTSREVAAVTGACLLTRRAYFDEVGGLNEDFPSSFNDVDYCLKVRSLGHTCVVDSAVVVVHNESSTRDPSVSEGEIVRFADMWLDELLRDPYYPVSLRIWDTMKRDWSASFEPRSKWGSYTFERSIPRSAADSVEGFLDAGVDLRGSAAESSADPFGALAAHLRAHGFAGDHGALRAECRSWPLVQESIEPSDESFDERRYVAANHDVAQAIGVGVFTSGREHWERFGRSEGRFQAAPPVRWLEEILEGR